jgi:hypothetical protein
MVGISVLPKTPSNSSGVGKVGVKLVVWGKGGFVGRGCWDEGENIFLCIFYSTPSLLSALSDKEGNKK